MLAASALGVWGTATNAFAAGAGQKKLPRFPWSYNVLEMSGSATMDYSGGDDFPSALEGRSEVQFALPAPALDDAHLIKSGRRIGGAALASLEVSAIGTSSWNPNSIHTGDPNCNSGTSSVSKSSAGRGGLSFNQVRRGIEVTWNLPFAEAANACWAPDGTGGAFEAVGKMSRIYPLAHFNATTVRIVLTGSSKFAYPPAVNDAADGTYSWDATIVLRRIKTGK